MSGIQKISIIQERSHDNPSRSEFIMLADQVNILKQQIKEIKAQADKKERVNLKSDRDSYVAYTKNPRF